MYRYQDLRCRSMSTDDEHYPLMYNEYQKIEYIFQQPENTQKKLTNRFKQFAKYEERYGKDLCEMSIDELKSIFPSLNIITPQTRTNVKSLISSYIDWCIYTKKTDKENSLKLLSIEDIASPNVFEIKMMKSPKQAQEILDIIYPEEYRNNYPNKAILNKLIFWLFYSGVPDKDIQVLKKGSIDYDKKIVHSPTQVGVIYEVFDEVLPLWEKFVDINEIEFESVGKRLGHSSKLVENDYLFRQFDNNKGNEHMQRHLFRNYLHRMFINYQKETGIYLLVSMSNMTLSGYFYRLYISGKTDKQIRKEIYTLNGSNKNKASSMFGNYKEWRRYFYER